MKRITLRNEANIKELVELLKIVTSNIQSLHLRMTALEQEKSK